MPLATLIPTFHSVHIFWQCTNLKVYHAVQNVLSVFSKSRYLRYFPHLFKTVFLCFWCSYLHYIANYVSMMNLMIVWSSPLFPCNLCLKVRNTYRLEKTITFLHFILSFLRWWTKSQCFWSLFSYSLCHVWSIIMCVHRLISHVLTIIPDVDIPSCHDTKLSTIFPLVSPYLLFLEPLSLSRFTKVSSFSRKLKDFGLSISEASCQFPVWLNLFQDVLMTLFLAIMFPRFFNETTFLQLHHHPKLNYCKSSSLTNATCPKGNDKYICRDHKFATRYHCIVG